MTDYKIGELILAGLKHKKMTQAQLANKLNVERATLNHWIKGKATPDANSFLNVAYVLNIPLDEIVRPHENIADQKRLIRLYESLDSEDKKASFMRIAYEVIKIDHRQ